MRYIFSVRADLTKRDINDLVNRIESTYPEGSETIMTLAERFREEGATRGKEEGKKEGLKKGERKALTKNAIKLLTKKFGPPTEDIRTKIEKLDVVTLEIIIDGIFEYDSLEDVRKYIK